MAENREREGKDSLQDEDDWYDPLLDDIYLETIMEEKNCCIGVAEEDPAHKTKEDVATQEKSGTPGGEHIGDHSCHKRSASIITTEWSHIS